MRKSFFVLIIPFVFLSACKFSTEHLNQATDKKDGEKTIEEFYKFLAEKKVDSAMTIFHPFLLASNDPVKLKDFLTNLSNQTAALKGRTLDHWDTKAVVGLEVGTQYNLYYINHYEGGQELKISIKMIKDEKDEIKILGFQVNPDKFVQP